jgi:hypothetical protein
MSLVCLTTIIAVDVFGKLVRTDLGGNMGRKHWLIWDGG